MKKVEEVLQHKEVTVLDSGICGQIRDVDIGYYAVKGAQCTKAWQAIYNNSDRTVIVVPEKINDGIVIGKDRDITEKYLASYPQINLEQWTYERWKEYDFDNEEDELAEIMEEVGEELFEPEPNHEFTIPYNILSQKPLNRLWLVDFTGIKRYEIPIYMQYGGWNANPMPDEQAAMLKHWHDKYGAELFGLTDDVLEMFVKRPPSNYDEAHILAKEQMVYCDDIVFQGNMTVERLAQSLVNSTSWYFWWD